MVSHVPRLLPSLTQREGVPDASGSTGGPGHRALAQPAPDSCPAAEPASDWVRRWSHLVAPDATVLDLACGRGRHLRWFAARGNAVTGVDRSPEALASMADLRDDARVELLQADLESGAWPLMHAGRPRRFDAIVVCNYLWRPLFPLLLQSLSDGGVLLYETFAEEQARIGRPSRPEFLLAAGELLRVCASLRVVAYEDGFCERPDRFVQRIAALNVTAGARDGPAAPVTPPSFGR